MTGQNATQLKEDLQELGFPKKLFRQIDYYSEMNIPDFKIRHVENMGKERMQYDLDFKTDEKGRCALKHYEAIYRAPVVIPDLVINSISVKQLDNDMAEINWTYDQHLDTIVEERMGSSEGVHQMEKVNYALSRLDELGEGGKQAVEMFRLLMYKHWTDGYYAQFVPQNLRLENQYETRLTQQVNDCKYDPLTATKTYDLLKTNYSFILNLKTEVMNQENFDYLKNQVKFTGFGEGLETELKEKMEQNAPEFQLKHQATYGKDEAEAVLYFRQSEQSGNFFMNKYDLSVKENQSEPMTQTFYIGKENNFTLKEAYNLMCGRAVHKELNKLEKVGEGKDVRYEPTEEKYKAWVQLDFKDSETNGNLKLKYFHENYGYNIEDALSKHPIKELGSDQDKSRLMESLQKGNRQSVTFEMDGKEQKRFIEASPKFKSINVYDGSMKRVRPAQKEEQAPEQSEKKSSRKTQKEEAGEDGTAEIKKKSNYKKQRIS